MLTRTSIGAKNADPCRPTCKLNAQVSLVGPAIDHLELLSPTIKHHKRKPNLHPLSNKSQVVSVSECPKWKHSADQPKTVVVVNVSPGVFHLVSVVGAGEGTKVPTEFGAMHTGSFPCKCTVPSGWLDICLDSLAGDSGDGTPGGIGNMIQAFELLACCGSSRVEELIETYRYSQPRQHHQESRCLSDRCLYRKVSILILIDNLKYNRRAHVQWSRGAASMLLHW